MDPAGQIDAGVAQAVLDQLLQQQQVVAAMGQQLQALPEQLQQLQQQVLGLQAQQAQQAQQPGPEPQQEPGFMPHLRVLRERKAAELAAPAAQGLAMKPGKLDPFVGEGDKGQEVLSFLEWATRYYSQPGRPERSTLVSYLGGAAAEWYSTVAFREEWSHDELLVQLGVRFHNEGRKVEALHLLGKLRQGSMHIAQFNQRFLQLAVASERLHDSDIVVRYAGACGPAAREVIRNRTLYMAPLPEVMQKVHEEVEMHARFGALVANVDGQGGAPQQQLGGPVPMELGALELGALRVQQRGQQGGGRGQGGRGKCYECGGRGHVQASCANATHPRPGSSCFRCGGNGHFARDCSARQQQPQQPPQQQQQGRFGALRNYRPKGAGRGSQAN